MGQVLQGNKLHTVREQLETDIKNSMNAETMNFLAFLNFVVERNKQYLLRPKGW